MLNAQTAAYLDLLYGVYARQGYKVRDWSDLQALLPEHERGQAQSYVADLRADGYMSVKYADENEICFTLTDKADLYMQEATRLRNAPARELDLLRGGEDTASPEPRKAQTDAPAAEGRRARRLRDFLWGVLGGLFGGALGGALVTLIVHFVAGG